MKKLILAALLAFNAQASAAALSVVQHTPMGEMDSLNSAREIVVTFSQAMVALTNNEDMGRNCPIRLMPFAPGRCRWRGTNTLVYEMSALPKPGTEYSVTVPKGTASAVSGDKLAEDVSWIFVTQRPRLESSAPAASERWVGLHPRLFLSFNLTMSAKNVNDYLLLEEAGLDEAVPNLDPPALKRKGGLMDKMRDLVGTSADAVKPQKDRLVPLKISSLSRAQFEKLRQQGALQGYRNSYFDPASEQVLMLQPLRSLKQDHSYRLWVMKGMPSDNGGLGTGRTQIINFETWYTLAFKGASTPGPCAGPGWGKFMSNESPSLTFSNPMDEKSFFAHLKISPAPPKPDKTQARQEEGDEEEAPEPAQENADEASTWGLYSYPDSGKRQQSHHFRRLGLQVGTTYHFELSAGAKDAFGNTLLEPLAFDYAVGDYCPGLAMPGGFAVLESQLPPRHPADGVNLKGGQLKLWRMESNAYVGALESIRGEYQAIGSFSGWNGNLVSDEAWSLPVSPNVRSRSYVDLSAAVKKGAGGLVGLTVAWKDHGGESRLSGALDNLTDLGLTFKSSPDSTLLWVTRLETGEPAAGVSVELRLSNNTAPWKGVTDAQGLAHAPGWRGLGIKSWDDSEQRPHYYAIAYDAKGDAVLGSDYNGGIEPWRLNVEVDYKPEERHHRGLVFSDRGVYRPGESIKFKGVFRSLDVDDWAYPSSKDFKLTLKNSRDEVVLTKDVNLSEKGSFDLSYDLAEDAPTGEWTLVASNQRRHLSSYAQVRVEAFKPAAFEVRVSPARSEVFHGEAVNAGIEGWYLYGAPMNAAAANWNVLFESSDFSPPGWDDFDFGQGWWKRHDRGQRSGGTQDLVLSAKGLGELSSPTKGLELRGAYRARVEVGVTSADRQRLFGRASVLVHPSKLYVGLKLKARVAEVGQTLDLATVVTDTKGAAVPGVKVKGKLWRVEHYSVRSTGMSGRLQWEHKEKRVDLEPVSLVSGDKPKEWTLKVDKPGEYYVDLELADAEGRPNGCSTLVYVAGPGEAWWGQEDHDLVQLVADKNEYHPGDEAKVLVQSPWGATKALVSIERETVLDSYVVDLKGGADLLHIPIKENYLPNAFVSVTLVRGRLPKADYDNDGLDLSKPAARFGTINLPVTPQGRRLSVSVGLDKSDYRPGDTVNVSVQARDAAGQGEVTEVTLYAVDEGVLQLTGYQAPDLFDTFYGPRALALMTADTRLHVLGQRSYGEKGEGRGGGGGAPALEGIDLRSNFRFLAHWSATIQTDAKGEAQQSFKLPDNLSAFRVMAVAHTMKRFGKGQARLTISKPLMLRPSLPRFARLADAFKGGVIIHNNSAKDALVTVEVQAAADSPLKISGTALRKISVGAGKAVETLWDLNAASLGKATLDFRASADMGAKESDGLRWSLPVSVPEKLETVATSGVTEDKADELLQVPSGAYLDKGKLKATLSSSALSGLQDGAQYLLEYPYGCLEQRLSRTLPIVAGAQMLEAFKLADLAAQKKSAQQVLEHLSDFQDGSGGYCYWPGCPHEPPSPYLTAYALDVAALARSEGYAIPQASLDRAVAWLKKSFEKDQDWGYPYSQAEVFAMRAYGLDAMSQYGQAPTGYLSQLYGRRDQLPFLGKAHLLKAAKKLADDPKISQTVAQELLNQAKVAPRSLHFEQPEGERYPWIHDSSVNATAQCLEALLSAQGGFAGDEKAVAWLVGERKDKGRWSSTQENAWGLRALGAYFKRYEAEAPKFDATLTLQPVSGSATTLWQQSFNGRSLDAPSKSFGLDQVFGQSQQARLQFAKAGSGRLYYGLSMSYMPKSFAKPAFEGFELERSVAPLGSKQPLAAGQTYQAGKRYVVTLRVKTHQDRTFVALTDPLPGGLEVIDSSFATESRSEAEKKEAQSPGSPGWSSGFQHSENYDDRVQVFANYMPQGDYTWSYLVQATTPGLYSKPSAWVEQMYEPEVFGRTASQAVDVR